MNNKVPQVTFIFDRYSRATSTRKAPVELRITYNKKQKYISTGVMLYSNQWKKGTITNCPDSIQISQILGVLMKKVQQVILNMMKDGNIDIFSIPQKMKDAEAKSINFINYCKQRATIRSYGKAKGTQKRYGIFLEHLEKWGRIIDFSDVNEINIIAYDRHMKDMKPVSRWGNYHKFLNLFIIDAIKTGYLARNPYQYITIDRGRDNLGLEKCLTPEEFRKLKIAKLPTESLERVRDLFIFQTYTCMSYADLKDFDARAVQEVKGTKMYLGNRIKTDKPFTIPILSPAWDILMRYDGKLPIISNVKYNLYLKTVAQSAGIDKKISSHWARHTGATLLLNEGVPMQIVSKICGHSSTKITEQVYAKLLDETVVDAIKEVGEKLK